MNTNETIGWGRVDGQALEIWDTLPIFNNHKITLKDKVKLLFYPKKFLLYNYLKKNLKNKTSFKILDIGCGTGAAMIEMKKLFGNRLKIYGVDVIALQVDIARERLVKYEINGRVELVDSEILPFADESFDAVYTSDVLGHVKNVQIWLKEINRILKPDGVLSMFAESKLGKHAYIRNYLLKHGLNTDPHAEFHISLFSKQELRNLLQSAGFKIEKMYSVFWAKFLVHPDELYPALQNQSKFFILRKLNKLFYKIKMFTRPFSLAVCEFYGLIEMLTIGRWVESQGYVILSRKSVKSIKSKE